MSRSLTLAAIVATLSCTPSREPAATSTNQGAVADTVTKLTLALFAAAERVDADATFGVFSSDSDAAHLNLGGQFTQDSLLKTYRPVYDGLQGQQVQLAPPTVTVLAPDAGVVSIRGHFIATPK